MTPVDVRALVGFTSLSERTVWDWANGRRTIGPLTAKKLAEAAEMLEIERGPVRPWPRAKKGDRYRNASLFPDVRLRVSAEERAALIEAAERQGLPVGVFVRNVVLRHIGIEPRVRRNTGSGLTEQRTSGARLGRRRRYNPVPCAVCGDPTPSDATKHVRAGRQKTARCVKHAWQRGDRSK